LHAWMSVFGNSEAAVRGLPVICGVASVIAVYATARAFFPGRRLAAFAAGAIIPLAPPPLFYSQKCRRYPLAAVIGVMALLALHRGLESGRRGPFIAHAALLAVGLYTHSYFLFLLPFGAVAALLAPGERLGRRRAFVASVLAAGAAGAAFAP